MPVAAVTHETAEPQTLAEIRLWHRAMVDELVHRRAMIQNAVRHAVSVSPPFVGMTESDVDAWYDVHKRELDRLTILNLVASAEATITVDYFHRVKNSLKDPLSRDYRKWYQKLSLKKQRRPNFDDDGILTNLKKSGVMDRYFVRRFRECLEVRHWIGHGRFWAKPLHADQFDPDEVFARAEALIKALSV